MASKLLLNGKNDKVSKGSHRSSKCDGVCRTRTFWENWRTRKPYQVTLLGLVVRKPDSAIHLIVVFLIALTLAVVSV